MGSGFDNTVMSLRNLSITLTPECQTQLTDWFAHSFSPEEIVRNLEVMYETCRLWFRENNSVSSILSPVPLIIIN